jgi:DNA-binding NarL/FixJ family response regulator
VTRSARSRVYPLALPLVLCHASGTVTLPTVLIVDDHDGFRMLVRALLRAEGFEVIGEAHDGESALEAARRLHPDLVLLDIQLPDIDGFAVAESLAGDEDAPPVVLTSSRARSDFGSQIGSSRVLGFVPKDELSGEALQALMPAPS